MNVFTWSLNRTSLTFQEQLDDMAALISIKYFRLPSCFRRFRSISFMVFPIAWLLCLLTCLFALLGDKRQLDAPRLRLEGLYSRQSHDDVLAMLGFVADPVLYPHAHHLDQDLPVFITTVKSEDLRSFHRFLGSFRLYFGQKKLLVYDLGLSSEELNLIRRTCQCLVRSIHWERYPEHVQDLPLMAFRPLLIQESLQEFGLVFWCDHTMRFNSSDLTSLRAKAETLGLVAWTSQDFPTSTFTHYGTFRYLNADFRHYRFQRMAEPDSALYCNTYRLHFKLMLPWVLCALDLNCISPPGARLTGCDVTRRPRYTYAGCHHYDTSVFNVILGDMFQFDTDYIPSRTIFSRELWLPPRSEILASSRRVGATKHSTPDKWATAKRREKKTVISNEPYKHH